MPQTVRRQVVVQRILGSVRNGHRDWGLGTGTLAWPSPNLEVNGSFNGRRFVLGSRSCWCVVKNEARIIILARRNGKCCNNKVTSTPLRRRDARPSPFFVFGCRLGPSPVLLTSFGGGKSVEIRGEIGEVWTNISVRLRLTKHAKPEPLRK